MNLVIDIGNSTVKTGCFNKGEMISSAVEVDFTPQKAAELIRRFRVRKCIVSSVRDHDEPLMEILRNNVPFLIDLSHTTPLPFKNLYHTPEWLGKDRIAAAAGAYAAYPGAHALIIDMGTAITLDILTSKSEYIGGNISPGLVMRFRALHAFTSRLPMFEKDAFSADPGTDTRSAIISGVQKGILYEINGYVDHFSGTYPELKVILTGGDAEFFADKLKKPIFLIPNLVLSGLNYILDYNAKQH
ncbi:MAG: pantothenate kinase [Bacteroidetes bacterium]|nr:pantothenate kinase [Bacteroidota bacterium]